MNIDVHPKQFWVWVYVDGIHTARFTAPILGEGMDSSPWGIAEKFVCEGADFDVGSKVIVLVHDPRTGSVHEYPYRIVKTPEMIVGSLKVHVGAKGGGA